MADLINQKIQKTLKNGKTEKLVKNALNWGSQIFRLFVRFSSIENFCNCIKSLRNFCSYYFSVNLLGFEIFSFENAIFRSGINLIKILIVSGLK